MLLPSAENDLNISMEMRRHREDLLMEMLILSDPPGREL